MFFSCFCRIGFSFRSHFCILYLLWERLLQCDSAWAISQNKNKIEIINTYRPFFSSSKRMPDEFFPVFFSQIYRTITNVNGQKLTWAKKSIELRHAKILNLIVCQAKTNARALPSMDCHEIQLVCASATHNQFNFHIPNTTATERSPKNNTKLEFSVLLSMWMTSGTSAHAPHKRSTATNKHNIISTGCLRATPI